MRRRQSRSPSRHRPIVARMSRLAATATVLSALLVSAPLVACGNSSQDGGSPEAASRSAEASSAPPAAEAPTSTTSTTLAAPTKPASATSNDPHAVAASLKEQVSSVGAVVKITEDNDANNLIGRPGQYDAASFFQDKRLDCSSKDHFNDLDTQCGGKIEHWESNADAKARVKDIQTKLKSYGLGAEYGFVRGALVLRLAGDLKPSQAKKYETA